MKLIGLLFALLLSSSAHAIIGTDMGCSAGTGAGSGIVLSTLRSISYASYYHNETCAWTRNSTVLQLPTGDATCSLTLRRNNGLTVSSVSDGTGTQPAIDVLFSNPGVYTICAYVSAYSTTAAIGINFSLTESTTAATILTGSMSEPATVGSVTTQNTMCGVFVSTQALTAYRFNVVFGNSSGVTIVNIGSALALLAGQGVLEWRIIENPGALVL